MWNRWLVIGLAGFAGLALVHCEQAMSLPPVDNQGEIAKSGGAGGDDDGDASADDASDATAAADASDAGVDADQ